MIEYQFRHSVTSKTVTAEQAFNELERIRAAHDERLNPHDIVEESRPRTAVLHPFFEWNDRVAGEAYRHQQARKLSRSVYIVRPAVDDAPAQEAPAYFNVESNNYQPQAIVMARTDLFQLALTVLHTKMSAAERAVRELEQLASQSGQPDRAQAIALAVQGFEAVRAAVALIR